MAAFAFARLRFPARNLLFFILLATLMAPTHVTIIPVFFVIRQLGWIDTHWSLTVPWCMGGAFGAFLLRQFFMKYIPGDSVLQRGEEWDTTRHLEISVQS